MRGLLLALLVLVIGQAPARAARHGETAVTLPDRTNYTVGPFLGYMNPYGGTGGVDSLTVYPSSFPNGSLLNWSWPATPCASVCGYMQLTYGNYDGGVPQTAITSKQAKNIVTLSEEFTLSTTGTAANFNVLNEFYLTSAQGDASTKVIEIGWFLSTSSSALTYFNSVTQLGTYTDSYGRVWKVAQDPTGGSAGDYIMQMPVGGGTYLNGPLDLKAAITFLTSQGKITGNEWFNGVAIGVEPVSGAGSMNVSRWAVVYN